MGEKVSVIFQNGLIKGKWSTAGNKQPQEPVMTLVLPNTRKYVELSLKVRGQQWASIGQMHYWYMPENYLAVL